MDRLRNRAEWLRAGAGRRVTSFILVLIVEGFMLWLLLSLSGVIPPRQTDETVTIVDVQGEAVSQEAPAPSSADQQSQAQQPPARQPETQQPPTPQPAEPRPAPPQPTPPAPPTPVQTSPSPLPSPNTQAPSSSAPQRPTRPSTPGRVYGPVDTGGPPGLRDSQVVGTAPNGQPLYGAAWYREPSDEELRGFLDTATGPGWGLIACRTAPNYRVEACVGLDEYPAGSQIVRAILAAAYQFQVRPPRRGGRELVGAWVRIRIDYGVRRR